jgi:large subunit ribosomal protein L17
MFRNMVTSLFKHERIRTTDAKAKELRRWADNMITLAKRGDLHARRQALSIIREKAVVHKLFSEAEEKYGATSGGYTRVVHLGRRPGDAAPVSLVELIFSAPDKKQKTRKKKKTGSEEKKQTAPKILDQKKTEKSETAKKSNGTETIEAVSEAPVEVATAAPDAIAEETAGETEIQKDRAGKPEKTE